MTRRGYQQIYTKIVAFSIQFEVSLWKHAQLSTCQTRKTVFDHISNHLEVRQKYSATRRIFNSLLGVWKCGQTLSFVFDK